MNRYRLPGVLGRGGHTRFDGLRSLVEQVQPRWVFQTHDEDKHAGVDSQTGSDRRV